MKNSVLSLFVFFQVFQSQAQELVVCDVETKKPIPFVTVLFGDTGVYANQFGKVELPNKIDGNGILVFTTVNYEKKSIAFAKLKDTLFLEPKPLELKEVVVHAEKEILEIKKTHRPWSFGSYPLVSMTELIAVVVPREKILDGYIESATFYFEKPRGYRRHKDEFKGGKAYVFVNVYSVKNGKSHKKIHTTQALEVAVMKDDELKVDLKATNLKIGKEGLGFGIEFISLYDNNGEKRDFSIRPALTDKESGFYSANTYFKTTRGKMNGNIYIRNLSQRYKEKQGEYRSLLMSFETYIPKQQLHGK